MPNAGVAFQSPIENFPDKEFGDTIDLNLKILFSYNQARSTIYEKKKLGKDHKYVECLGY